METRRYRLKDQKRVLQTLKNQKEVTESDDWTSIKKHPLTRIVLIAGSILGFLYASSYFFDAATKATSSFKNLRRAIKR